MKNFKIKELITSKIGIAFITGFIWFTLGIIVGREEVSENMSKISKLESENQDLQIKVDEAKPWFDMKEEERQAKKEEAEKAKKEAEAKAAAEAKKAKEKAEKAKKEAEAKAAAEAKKGYNTGITYNQLARTPDNYLNKKVKFKGKVLQVMEGDSETQIRLAVNDNYDTVLYCGISKELTNNNRILENDFITIYGISLGLMSYKSTLGGDITIPAVMVDKFE